MERSRHRLTFAALALGVLGCASEPSPQGPSAPGFALKQALVGESAGWIFAESSRKLELEVQRYEGVVECLTPNNQEGSDEYHWIVPGLRLGDRFRILDGGVAGQWLRPRALDDVHSWSEEIAFWNDEGMSVGFGQPAPGIGIWFGLMDSSGGFEPVDVECLQLGRLENCRSSTALAVQSGFPPVFLTAEEARWWDLAVAYAPVGEDGRLRLPKSYLTVDSHRVISLGGQVIWGDLHGHSSLSQDGCEAVDTVCKTREEEPALTFFDEAISNGLDFAALTDHAELEYWETPATLGETRSIWETQSDRCA